jgi:hypothetical protein
MDFATTMGALSWEFYNRFFNVLVDYGIVYLPLLMFLYKNWLSEKMLGTDANHLNSHHKCNTQLVDQRVY